jgi:hypothetical protein
VSSRPSEAAGSFGNNPFQKKPISPPSRQSLTVSSAVLKTCSVHSPIHVPRLIAEAVEMRLGAEHARYSERADWHRIYRPSQEGRSAGSEAKVRPPIHV